MEYQDLDRERTGPFFLYIESQKTINMLCLSGRSDRNETVGLFRTCYVSVGEATAMRRLGYFELVWSRGKIMGTQIYPDHAASTALSALIPDIRDDELKELAAMYSFVNILCPQVNALCILCT